MWLREPTRVAGIGPVSARRLLVLLVAVLIGVALVGDADVSLGDRDHAAIVAAMQDGSDYYGLIGGIVPAGAFAGRSAPLPTLALVESAVGTLGATILLGGVIAGILLIGWDRLSELFADARGKLLGAALLLGGTSVGALLVIVEPYGGWAALLATWSLLLRRRGCWIEAAGIACAAATIEPAAILLAVIMAGAAWWEQERREAIGWVVVVAVALVTWAAHRFALSAFSVAAVGQGSGIAPFDLGRAALMPGVAPWLDGVALVVAVAGWSVMPGDLARRVWATALSGVVVAYAPGMQWASVLTIVLLPLGLVFAIDAGATLVTAARSRRRITVTRVTHGTRSDA